MKNILKLIVILTSSIGSCFYLPTSFSNTKNEFHEYRFDNGLKLIIQEDHRSPIVNLSVLYKVGFRHEPLYLKGISHAVEHITITRATDSLSTLKSLYEMGDNINAYTRENVTNYNHLIPKDYLRHILALEAKRMGDLQFDPEGIKTEFQVMMEEMRWRKMNTKIIMENLKNFTVKQIENWYKAFYVPNNAMIVIVGDVNPKQTYEWVKGYFGNKSKKQIPQVLTNDPNTQPSEKQSAKTSDSDLNSRTYYSIYNNVPMSKVNLVPYALRILGIIMANNIDHQINNICGHSGFKPDQSFVFDFSNTLDYKLEFSREKIQQAANEILTHLAQQEDDIDWWRKEIGLCAISGKTQFLPFPHFLTFYKEMIETAALDVDLIRQLAKNTLIRWADNFEWNEVDRKNFYLQMNYGKEIKSCLAPDLLQRKQNY